MRQMKRKALDRIFAMILSLMIIIAMMPINVLAVEKVSGVITTNISEKTFTVNESTEFTFTTIANDDANTMVKGSFEFSNPDAIEKLEYLESKNGKWYEFSGDFGPETGFPMIDGTSTFRATFNKAGKYTVTAAIKRVADNTVICSTKADVVVDRKVSILTTDIEEKIFNIGESTEFTFTTTANDDANTMVKGSFEFSDPDAIEKLEYLESKNGKWYEFNGDFGPETGFPMIDGTSTFRATFNKAGKYTVTVSMKSVADNTVLCSTKADVVVERKASILTTSIAGKTFNVGESAEFTFTTTANDDANVMVKGSFEFSDPDAIEKLEYLESKNGEWYEFSGDFGPETGFPMINGTSKFRVTFNKAGKYTVTASMKSVADNTVLCSTKADVIVENKVTVSVVSNEGGTVSLNDDTSNSLTVDAGTGVKVIVKALDGYQIAYLNIGGMVASNAVGKTNFSVNTVVSRDVEVKVVFVKVWKVTVTHNENGKVNITPADEGGSVVVTSGTEVVIKATPDNYYNVNKVVINGKEDKNFTSKNDATYEKTLKADREYTIEVTFAPNVYNINIEDTKNGSISTENSRVEYNGNAKITIVPDDGFTVNNVSVIDSVTKEEVPFTTITKENGEIYFNINKISSNLNVNVSFKETEKAEKTKLMINSEADLRPDDDNLIVIKDGSNVILSTKMSGIRVCAGENIFGGESVQSVKIDSTMIVSKVELYYQAEDEYYADWHIVEMDNISIVVDKGNNITASLVADSTANANGYYNSDITFKVKAEDTGDYSGLEIVEYWIVCNGVVGAKTALYTHNTSIKNIFEDDTNLVVDSSLYNSDDVTVVLRVADRAGNEKLVEQKLKINSTKPTVSLDISGTKFDNAKEGCYNDNRELTITIVDREDTFSAENLISGMAISKNGVAIKVNKEDITWSHTDNLHIGKYLFDEEGHYEWSVSYTNIAGLSNNGVTAPTDKFIYDFYVDKMAPYNLKVTYEPTFVDVIIETITFGFYKAPVNVTVEATDDSSLIEQFEYSYTVEAGASSINTGKDKTLITGSNIKRDGNRAYATFTIPAQFRGKVSFSATDRAGRTAGMTDVDRTIVVDTIAPGVTVEYDNTDVYNGKYYNSDRTATIKITEDNFFGTEKWNYSDLYDFVPGTQEEHLVITVVKVLNDGTSTTEKMKPKFIKIEDSNVYEGKILFNEDADYTFDIKYTDRSGNIYDSYPENNFVVDKIEPVIKVSFDNNDCINKNQFKSERNATVTVVEHNFDMNGITAVVNDAAYGLKWAPVDGQVDTYYSVVPFTGNQHYIFDIGGVDYANNKNSIVDFGESVAPNDFTVDSSGPENLKIKYEPTFVGTLLENLTFGFYKAPVIVRIEATDNVSGIDYFTYSYVVQDDVSDINIGKSNVKVDVDGITASTTFEIPAQFRGFVSFEATSNAGVTSGCADKNVVVVDTLKPGIVVTYSNNNVENDEYYNAERTATIAITEANFFAQDINDGHLIITRAKELNNGKYIQENLKPSFLKKNDVYTATIPFDEDADYTLDITYTDRAGNVNDSHDSFVIDRIKPQISIDNANGAYFKSDRTVKITVVEHNFRANDFKFNAEAYDVLGQYKGNKIDLTSKGYQAYLQNQKNWTKVARDTWEAEITFDIEGNYIINATYTDLAGNEQEAPIKDTFCVDKSLPENLKITYNPTFIGTLLETITFGFYQAPVTVIIEATDNIAGIDHFVYSYDVDADASKINTGKSKVNVSATSDEGTNRFYTTFEVPAQFRGKISFDAYDKAENKNSLADKNVVIVDDIDPVVKVEYDNHNDFYDNHFKNNRTAKITITEANFFGTKEWNYADFKDDLLVINVDKTMNDGQYSSAKMKPEFEKVDDVYTAEILFDENADYTFDISYTDRSGNVFDSYEMDSFTVDNIKPLISVEYNDTDPNVKFENGNQFRTDREAKITITEHNFNAADVVAKVMANGTEIKEYAEYLKKQENWTHNGDVHTATINYTTEAHYTFDIYYTDMAGNVNENVTYGSSVAPTAFTIDKSAPTDMDIKINNESVVGSMTSIAFNKFYDNTVEVKLYANCDISGLQSLKYQKIANVYEYAEDGIWRDYNEDTGIVVSPSEKFVIYFRAEDRAGNVNIIRSTGIVVDNQKPVGETMAPEIDILPAKPNKNGIHNDNVVVDLKIVDPKYVGSVVSKNGYYSGLNKITYKIYTKDTTATEENVLFDLAKIKNGAVFDSDNLASSWSGKIVIDAEKFNSNNVIVEVTAVDNAGNSRTSTTVAGDIKIDITTPTIKVSYDNNSADSKSYFKSNRRATIVVTERNFNEKDVIINLKNTDGKVPTVSKWNKTEGTGNKDNTRWTASISYVEDGDYKFSIEYTDLAGLKCSKKNVNYGTSVAPNSFTIDKTKPVVSVSYDNNSARNTRYYNQARVATIVITEHNLEPNGIDNSRVVINMKATDDGKKITAPVVSKWITEGDKHTATINYMSDALYTFDIAIKDKANNDSVDFAEQTFYVDKTAPSLEITGVANKSANNGDVAPIITCSDTNYDADQFEISLDGANRKSVNLDGGYTDIHNGSIFTFSNFAKEKEIDDIYTLTASLTDRAGNITTKAIKFSVNRFGSTYALSKSAEKLNGTYVKEAVDVVITETNVDKLSDIKITLFKDNETVVLSENTDYKTEITRKNGEWYHYTYTVFAKNFEADGVYSLTVESNDSAGNVAKNNQDTKDTAISFGVDSTLPIINIENIDSNTTYAMDNLSVEMSVKDNLKLTKVIVELDGKEIKVWSKDSLDEIIKNGGNFTFDITGESTDAHNLVVYAIDAAGNGEKISDTEIPANVEEIKDFYVTTNIWVRYYTNKVLFFGSIIGVLLVTALIVFLVVYKKKKNEKK